MKNFARYPNMLVAGQAPVAERVQSWQKIERLVPEILDVTGEAYLAELVKKQHARDVGGRLLTEASVRKQYDGNNQEVVDRHLTRLRTIHDRGAQLIIVRASSDSNQLIGYGRIAPAPGMTENAAGGHDYEGWYLNNLVVNPAHGRKGWGGLILRSSLAIVEAQPKEPLVLDAINGNNGVNGWYRKLGFEPDPATPTGSLRFGPQLVGETYYVAPSIGGVVLNLELGQPALAGMIAT